MGREEQIEEREVLDSIFPDEITDLSETEYRISILLDITNDDGDESEPPIILLQVKYPEAYPDEAPGLQLSAPPNAPAHPYFDISYDKDELLLSLNETIEENLGMAMVFTLVSTLKDLAEQLVAKRQAEARDVHEAKLRVLEMEENKKFHGTPVNPETFSKWRIEFRTEMQETREKEDKAEEAAELKRNRGKETVDRLTGRQLWERGLVGKVEEEESDEEDEEGSELAKGVQKVKV